METDLERLRAIGLDPNFSDPPVYGPQPASAQTQPAQLSVLDMLRKRMANEMENEPARRLSDLGNALLASRSPNFLTALGEGFAAQDTGSRSRMEQLRQIADAERQQRALESQEAARRDEAEYRRQNLTLREREIAQQNRPQYQVIGTDAQGNAIVIDMRNPTQRQTLEGVTPTQVSSLNARLSASDMARAAQAGNNAVRDEERRRNEAVPRQPALTGEERDRTFREAAERFIASTRTGATPATPGTGSGGASTPQQPAPARTLPYPRIAPQQ